MLGYSDETRELAYQRWQARVPLPQISDELGVSPRTLETWRAVDGWVAREAREAAERMERQRRQAERRLNDELPTLLERILDLAYGATSERIQFEATRYLLGTLGYAPDTSADRLRTLATTLATSSADEELASRSPAEIAAELNALLLGVPTAAGNGAAADVPASPPA